jgi:hypothetical protein
VDYLRSRDSENGKYQVYGSGLDPAIWKPTSVTIIREVRVWVLDGFKSGWLRRKRATVVHGYALKVSALKNGTIPIDNRLNLFGDSVDVYTTQSALSDEDAWKAYFIINIAIGLAIITGGKSGVAAAAIVSSMLLKAIIIIAFVISAFGLILSIVLLALMSTNELELAQAFGKFQEDIAPAVRVAGYITIVTAIYAAAQNAADLAVEEIIKEQVKEQAAKGISEEVVREALKTVQAELVKELLIKEVLIESLKAIIKEVTGISGTKTQIAVKLAAMMVNTKMQNDLNRLKTEVSNEKTKLAEEKALAEYHNTSDMLRDMMKTEFVPLLRDGSEQDNLYERPYVKWSTGYHTGNMMPSFTALYGDKDDRIVL